MINFMVAPYSQVLNLFFAISARKICSKLGYLGLTTFLPAAYILSSYICLAAADGRHRLGMTSHNFNRVFLFMVTTCN